MNDILSGLRHIYLVIQPSYLYAVRVCIVPNVSHLMSIT